VRHGFEPFIHQDWQIDLLEALPAAPRLRVWLKIDTGMHRLGFPAGQAAAAAARLAACRAVVQPAGLATHLAEAERADGAATRSQLEAFAAATAGIPGERSVANSAGLVAWPAARADWVRPGIMLYGISPFPERTGAELGLLPAMTFETRVIALRELAAGERVGYGATWTAARPSRIAVAAVGYGDGYPRAAANGTPVTVAGAAAAVAGRPSMDMLAIDVTGLPHAAVGDRVELWGREVPVERVAAASGTIAYELTCRVGRRVVYAVSGA
jgi:alanine racemase